MADSGNPIIDNNGGGRADLSAIVNAIQSLSVQFGDINSILNNISNNSLSRNDFNNLIRNINRNGNNSGNNNTRRNYDNYEPRAELRRRQQDQNEISRNLEQSRNIIKDFTFIINNTRTSFNNLNRILDRANRDINRNLEDLSNLQLSTITNNLQLQLNNFVNGVAEHSAAALITLQQQLSRNLRDNQNNLIQESSALQRDLQMQSLTLRQRQTSLRDQQQPQRNLLQTNIQQARSELETVLQRREELKSNLAENEERFNRGEIEESTRNSVELLTRLLLEDVNKQIAASEYIISNSTQTLSQLDRDINNLNTDYTRSLNNFINTIESRDIINREQENLLNQNLDTVEQISEILSTTTSSHAELLNTSRELSRQTGGLLTSDFSNIADTLANIFGLETASQEEQSLKPFEDLVEGYIRSLDDIDERAEKLNIQSEKISQRIEDLSASNGLIAQQDIKIENLKSDILTNNEALVNKQTELATQQANLVTLQEQLRSATTEDDIEDLKEQINKQNETISGTLSEIETITQDTSAAEIQLEAEEIRLNNLKQEQELLEAQQENIVETQQQLELQRDQIEQEKTNAEKMLDAVRSNMGLIPQLLKKALDFAGGLVKKAINEGEQYIKDAADKVYDSFERLQETLGKTLKMNSGAYDEFKQQMLSAAEEVGLSIDVTQLNEAAASMAELGIRDTELLKDFAVGASILSETGSKLQLNEDLVRQLQAGYQENIRTGMSQQEASQALIDNFYEIAAAEKLMTEKYGNTLALSNGGTDMILTLFDQLSQAGYVNANDLGSFYANMGDYLAAMESAGIDSSTLITDFNNILSGNMSSLNTELKGWFQLNPYATTDDFLKAIAADFSSTAQSFESFRASLYEGMDEQAVSYAGPAFGTNLTNLDVMGRQKRISTANELFGEGATTTQQLTSAVTDIKHGLERGDWLSANTKIEKGAIDLMDDVASEFQNLPDGRTIMDEGFNIVNEGIDNIVSGIGNIIALMLSGNLFNSSLNLGGAGGTAGTQLRNFLIGGEGVAGVAGKVVGSVAGTGMMIYSAAQHGEDLMNDPSEGLYNVLTDSTFTSGLGTAIGGALGGPVGAAMGGVLGKFLPTIENKVESFFTRDMNLENTAQIEAARKLEEASQKLTDAGLAHKDTANSLTKDLNTQRQAFSTFTDNQKQTWLMENENLLKSEGLIDEQTVIGNDTKTNNQLFEAATSAWIEYTNKQILKESALGEADKFTEDLNLVQDTSGLGISLEDIGLKSGRIDESGHITYSSKDIHTKENEARTEKRKNFAQRLINLGESNPEYASIIESYMTEEELQDLAETGEGLLMTHLEDFTKAYTEVSERMSDTKALINSEDLQSKLDAISKYAEAENINTTNSITEAATSYLMATGSFSEEEASYEAELLNNAVSMYKNMEDTQSNIKTKWNNATRNNKQGLTNRQVWDSLSDIDKSLLDTNSDAYKNWANAPATTGSFDSVPLVSNVGKYATGLDYVPYDNFPALLHKGEMILTADDAMDYRNVINDIVNDVNSTTSSTTYGNNVNTVDISGIVDTTNITNSVDNQTNAVVGLLEKILNILVSTTNTGSRLPLSLVQLDSNLNRL